MKTGHYLVTDEQGQVEGITVCVGLDSLIPIVQAAENTTLLGRMPTRDEVREAMKAAKTAAQQAEHALQATILQLIYDAIGGADPIAAMEEACRQRIADFVADARDLTAADRDSIAVCDVGLAVVKASEMSDGSESARWLDRWVRTQALRIAGREPKASRRLCRQLRQRLSGRLEPDELRKALGLAEAVAQRLEDGAIDERAAIDEITHAVGDYLSERGYTPDLLD